MYIKRRFGQRERLPDKLNYAQWDQMTPWVGPPLSVRFKQVLKKHVRILTRDYISANKVDTEVVSPYPEV